MAFSIGMPWNEGEEKMHHLLRVPPQDNPTSAMLTPQASFMFQRAPLLAFGTLDAQSRPWATLWGGEPGFSEQLGGGFIGTRTLVDGTNDPVVQALISGNQKGEMTQAKDGGKLVAGLAIDLMTRKRVKTAGRMIAGAIRDIDVEIEGEADRKQEQIQLVTKIEQSLGNCPKYLNQYEIRPALVNARLVSQSSSLSKEGEELVARSDMFFLSTTTEDDMDVNHRGGPAGFVRMINSSTLVYPEYSGNRLYQSLGNLMLNPKIGIVFPDYGTGDVLYLTGTTEILAGADAAVLLPGSNLAVKITISECRFVANGLPFRGSKKTPSPYNPLVRTLASEGNIRGTLSVSHTMASLTKKEVLTPSIARFTFTVRDGITYQPGQWIALDFSKELDIGYEHMRDDDPGSLNDDFVRTFTISSMPNKDHGKESEFEMTIRNVGTVTRFLFQQNERAGLEIGALGVGEQTITTANSKHETAKKWLRRHLRKVASRQTLKNDSDSNEMQRKNSLRRPRTAPSTELAQNLDDAPAVPLVPIDVEQVSPRAPVLPPIRLARPDSGVIRDVNAWLDASVNTPSPPLMRGLPYWRAATSPGVKDTPVAQHAVPLTGVLGIARPSTANSQQRIAFRRCAKKMQVQIPSLLRTKSQRQGDRKHNRQSASMPLLAVSYEDVNEAPAPMLMSRSGSFLRPAMQPSTRYPSTRTSALVSVNQQPREGLPLRTGTPGSVRLGDTESVFERRVNAIFMRTARSADSTRPSTAAACLTREDSMGDLSDAPTYISGLPPPSYRSRPESVLTTSSFGCIDGMNPAQRRISQQRAALQRGEQARSEGNMKQSATPDHDHD
ncbi:hypothetical protein AALT_g275 [Alternaria alternata]|nr:hypothetical protein AALT_g275 [Alternaria alternata]